MFIKNGIIYRSDIFDNPRVAHGFSGRAGGVSTITRLASLNLADGLGDTRDNVKKNTDIFARAVSDDRFGGEQTVRTNQIHSARVRILDSSNAGEGYSCIAGEDADGFVTDVPGIMPIIRTADCVPILLCGEKADSSPVIGAVHAGWRGTVLGIAGGAVEKMVSLGCVRESIRAAIGTHIKACCYEVDDPFYEAVAAHRSADFAARHIKPSEKPGKYMADLTEMNIEILEYSGVKREMLDISPYCSACDPETFFSHRGSRGKRGTMGAGIVIIP